jgi:hypothetical protein
MVDRLLLRFFFSVVVVVVKLVRDPASNDEDSSTDDDFAGFVVVVIRSGRVRVPRRPTSIFSVVVTDELLLLRWRYRRSPSGIAVFTLPVLVLATGFESVASVSSVFDIRLVVRFLCVERTASLNDFDAVGGFRIFSDDFRSLLSVAAATLCFFFPLRLAVTLLLGPRSLPPTKEPFPLPSDIVELRLLLLVQIEL